MDYYDDSYMWPQEHTTSYPVAYQDSVSFSTYEPYDLDTYDSHTVYEFDEAKFIDHYHGADDNGWDYGYSYNPRIDYLAYNYVEPKLIEYEPIKCDTVYVSYHTHYSIANSEKDSGFNEPEFEEYDPTPYGGGYDIVSVYGKPLPPSDQTCYPRSNPKLIKPGLECRPKNKPNTGPERETMSGPKLEPEHEPMHVPVLMPPPKPTPTPSPARKHVSFVDPEPDPSEPKLEPLYEPLRLDDVGEREREEYSYPAYGYDYSWPEYDNGNGNGNGIGVGYDYRYGKQVAQIPPCEYNPEVVDLCENIFGNWPCLARIRKQQMRMDTNPGIACPEFGDRNPWEDCANYIFGGPIASYNQ